mmetsp:Transcript_38314/g.97976  ORF Transcript_38314/g.97976 Transcript_38314/m.97976 type:complete len:107 (+) Transcript_38314:242-562(+)
MAPPVKPLLQAPPAPAARTRLGLVRGGACRALDTKGRQAREQEMGFLLLTPRKCLQQSLVLRLPQLMQYPSRMLNTSKREGTVPLGVKPRSLDLMEGVTDLSIMAS